jgi:hypothetical protein
METILLALLPLILIALVPVGMVLLVTLLASLAIRFASKQFRMVLRAQNEFSSKMSETVDHRIKVHGSARSKKDLESWDFIYQKNRWIAEHQDLIASAARSQQENAELYEELMGELLPKLKATRKLPFPLRKLEGRKVEKALSKISWPQVLVLHFFANYTSPAGRVNLNDSEVYTYDLREISSASTVSSVPTPLIFDDPRKLQFPGVYVYSYPSFMEGREIFPVKIGKSESSVHARVKQQIAQGGAAIPEDPIIICAIRLDQGAGIAESLLHASFRAKRTQGGGTEWFSISLKELRDELTARKYSSTWNKELGSARYQGVLKGKG